MGKIMFGISLRKNARTNVQPAPEMSPGEARLTLLQILYTEGTQSAPVGSPVFDVAITLSQFGLCDVRVGDPFPVMITITAAGVDFIEMVAAMYGDDFVQ
jgi:hypothetical protein